MSGMALLAWISSFGALVLMTYGILLAYDRRRKIQHRVEEPETSPSLSVLRRLEVGNPVVRRLFEWLSIPGQWVRRNQEQESHLQTLLIQGGFRHPSALTVFYGIKAMVALLLPIPFLLLVLVRDRLGAPSLVVAFLLGAVGYYLPMVFLGRIVRRRQERIDKALPDVVDLFIICMEAGLALQATINRVAEEIRGVCPEFYRELQITGGEMRTGLSRDVCLRNLGQRTGVQSVQSLGTLMIQSEKMGTSIAQSLRAHADFVRVQRTLRAEEMAAKLPVKILIPLIFFIFPAMFIVVVGPAIIKVAKNLFPIMRGIGGH